MPADDALVGVLEVARTRGFLGPGPVERHIAHGRAFVAAVAPPARFLDLGSGGGIPGLLCALAWETATGVLLDAQQRRTTFLDWAAVELGVSDRIETVTARSEAAARQPALRGAFDVVTARSFARPAVTAECGAPFLRVGGTLLVSEPPAPSPDRWPIDGLGQLGLVDDGIVRVDDGTGRVRVLRSVAPCPDRWPRRDGVPAKRPLF
ncbi:MAG: RsmG family class I SAM-dependent methyltransferase [Acidimicrobiales bacterium]